MMRPAAPRPRRPNRLPHEIRSDPDISKAVAAAGIRAVPCPRIGGRTRDRRTRRHTAREGAAPRDGSAARDAGASRDGTLERESGFERSISTSRPTTLQAIDLSLNVVSHGKLTWRTVLAWLREDKFVSAEDVERTARRFAGGNSAQHPLVRISSAGADAESATARCSTPRR